MSLHVAAVSEGHEGPCLALQGPALIIRLMLVRGSSGKKMAQVEGTV